MSKLEQRVTIAAVVLPFVGFIAAVVLAATRGAFTWLDLGIFLFMYLVSGAGITVGYHRLFTHRSFETTRPIKIGLAIAGSMSVQGAPIHWVADHRKHHDFSDEPGDPHSPHTHGKSGWRGVIAGWWHSHMGWLFSRDERASASRYARDLKNDPDMVWVDKHFFSWVLLGLAIPFTLGFVLSGGDLFAAFTGLLWGGFARIFLQHHATWSVNSICHMVGDQPFELEDKSRNNWAVAFVSLGEGWHHNHHAFPTSAKHGLTGRQIDPAYIMIKSLEKLGLAWDLRQPSDEAIQKKLRVVGSENTSDDAHTTFAPQPDNGQRSNGSNESVPDSAMQVSAIPDGNEGAAIAASPLSRTPEDDPDRQAVA